MRKHYREADHSQPRRGSDDAKHCVTLHSVVLTRVTVTDGIVGESRAIRKLPRRTHAVSGSALVRLERVSEYAERGNADFD